MHVLHADNASKLN